MFFLRRNAGVYPSGLEVLLMCCVATLPLHAVNAAVVSKVALAGDATPNQSGHVFGLMPFPSAPTLPFPAFQSPSLNDQGQVAFLGFHYDPTKSDWTQRMNYDAWGPDGQGGLMPFFPAGVGPRTSLSTAKSSVVLNNRGEVAFTASYNNKYGVWASNANGSTRLIAQEYMASPFAEGSTFRGAWLQYPSDGTLERNRTFYGPSIDENGQVGYRATSLVGDPTSDDSYKDAYYLTAPDGTTQFFAPEDQSAEGLNNRVYALTDRRAPRFNQQGDIVYYAVVKTPDFVPGQGLIPLPSEGIWLKKSGQAPTLVAHNNMLSPTPGQVRFEQLSESSIHFNNHGEVVFWGAIDTPLFPQDNASISKRGIWLADAQGQLETIVIGGETAVGAAPGDIFRSMFRPFINDLGDIVFTADTANPNTQQSGPDGIWRRAHGQTDLELLLMEETPVPGMDDWQIDHLFILDQNERGDLAIEIRIERDSDRERGIFVYQASTGDFIPLAVTGKAMTLTSGETVVADTIFWSEHSFNEQSAFAFHGLLSDGRDGIFIAAIPEPQMLVFMLLGLIGVCGRRRASVL